MSHSFKVVWASGDCRYFHRRAAACQAYWQPSEHPVTQVKELAESWSRVELIADAFERAANGNGGYELREEVMHTRKKIEEAS